ncbi:MAG TPA: hypothetical protein VK158_02935 [Acidobacteriota bacterium]|nr:hypothetical protein [Acidobacteriota bacterium]
MVDAEEELDLIKREEQYSLERFNFKMFLFVGLILGIIGTVRIFQGDTLNFTWVNIGIFALGAVVSFGLSYLVRTKQASQDEIKWREQKEKERYEVQSSDFGFTEEYHKNEALDEYKVAEAAKPIEADVAKSDSAEEKKEEKARGDIVDID